MAPSQESAEQPCTSTASPWCQLRTGKEDCHREAGHRGSSDHSGELLEEHRSQGIKSSLGGERGEVKIREDSTIKTGQEWGHEPADRALHWHTKELEFRQVLVWQVPRRQVNVARHQESANHSTRRCHVTPTAMAVPSAGEAQRQHWNPVHC